MLDNPLKREGVKAVAATGALIAGGPVAAGLAITLGVAVEALGMLGEKRTAQLFDSEDLTSRVVAKINESDDFASFVFSVWQKHNLESSDKRRVMLKNFLEKALDAPDEKFENFSHIEYIIQNISLRSLRLLDIFYSDTVLGSKIDPSDYTTRMFNLERLIPLIKDKVDMTAEEVEYFLGELAGYNLVFPRYGRMNGTFYEHTALGRTFLSYVQS